MSQEREEPQAPVRRTKFSRRAGFSYNPDAGTTYGAENDHEDEVLDPLSPEVVAEEIRSAPALPPPTALTESEPERMNAQRRAAEVMMLGDASYVEEHRLEFVARMLQRKVSLDLIARELNVSLTTVQRDRAKLRQMARDRTKTMDIDELIGTNLALYDEAQSMALRIASDGTVPTPMKLAALRTTLTATGDRMRMLESAGVFDVLRFRKGDTSQNVSAIQLLMERTGQLLEKRAARMAQPEEKKPIVKRLPRRGFAPMTLQDGDDQEIMEI